MGAKNYVFSFARYLKKTGQEGLKKGTEAWNKAFEQYRHGPVTPKAKVPKGQEIVQAVKGKSPAVRPKGEVVKSAKGKYDRSNKPDKSKELVHKPGTNRAGKPDKSKAPRDITSIGKKPGKIKVKNANKKDALKLIAALGLGSGEAKPTPAKTKTKSKPKTTAKKTVPAAPKYDLGVPMTDAEMGAPRPGFATTDPLNLFGNKNGINPFSSPEREAFGYSAFAPMDAFRGDVGAGRESLTPPEQMNAAMTPADLLAFDRNEAQAGGYLPQFNAQQAVFNQPAPVVAEAPVVAPAPIAPAPVANRLQQKYVPESQIASDAARISPEMDRTLSMF